jgi:P27 family predicted phage terminase small subunit
MGRKPQPTALKKLNGNPGKRPLPENEVTPTGKAGEAPEWLSEIGKRKWNEIKAILESINLVTDADRDFLAVYCDSYAEYVELTGLIEKQGRISVSEKGAPYQNPLVGQKNKAVEKMIKIGARFGMSPSDRTGLQIEIAMPDEDEVALMMEV